MQWKSPKNEESDNSVSSVISNDTRIYFYSDISDDRILQLTQQLRDIDEELQYERIVRGTNSKVPIWLHINSQGGDVFPALAAVDLIAQLHSPVYSVVEGVAASSATLLSVACTKRFIRPNSFMLIHEITSAFFGKHAEFIDQLRMQEMLVDKFMNFYASKTKLTIEDLKDKWKRDFWMDAQQALEYGFVDSVLI